MECLVVEGEIGQSQKKVPHVVTKTWGSARQTEIAVQCPQVREYPKSVLERICHDIHLISAKFCANTDVVFSANYVERISNVKHVSSTLERRKSAVAKRPISPTDNR